MSLFYTLLFCIFFYFNSSISSQSFKLNSSNWSSVSLSLQNNASFLLNSFRASSIRSSQRLGSQFYVDDVFSFATVDSGPVLNFPNPFRVSEGTTLSFNLNSSSFSSPIEFLLYNLFGEEVFRSSFAFNHPNLTITPVTVSNINIFNFKFFFGPSFFNSDYVLPGVYFYIVRSADMLIGKGKMGIIP